MNKKITFFILIICATLTAALAWSLTDSNIISYPETKQIPEQDTLHGTQIIDPYRWLEKSSDPAVQEWEKTQQALTLSALEKLPQKEWVTKRLNELCRYDDASFGEVIEGKRRFWHSKKADEDRWILSYQDNLNDSPIVLLNPNEWDAKETLEFNTASRDGAYVAFAKAHGGNETGVIQVLEVATGKVLPDLVKGSKQGWPNGYVSWLPGNIGFLYSANPAMGEVPEGEETYWNAVYFHRLGTSPEEDRKIFSDPQRKENFHRADVSEDGKFVIFTRSHMGKLSQVYILPADNLEGELQPVTTAFDASYGVTPIEDKLLILTDKNAPNSKVFITDIQHPEEEHWKELIPESEDSLVSISPIGGHLYAAYIHHAHSVIKAYSLEGEFQHEIILPSIGSAEIEGHWSKPEVWIDFVSFITPHARYQYDFEKRELQLIQSPSLVVQTDAYQTEQIWYPSKDGTAVSMFLIHKKSMIKDGQQPVLLTGYGGFGHSLTPVFSGGYVTFLEAGGMIAIPNLRGGGEYGRSWHEAGKKQNKQNVFDDFIAAAEWLIENQYTHSGRLAIRGGSNGGLLVGAVMTQRPELFCSVLCEVPLLDMVRYHHFGFSNIWSEEYGSAADPEQFQYLLRYSPYHNIVEGYRYPATLITASENDSRVDPLHARKMVARLQAADQKGGPFFLMMNKDAGHGGGTTVSARIAQTALTFAFLLDTLQLKHEKE